MRPTPRTPPAKANPATNALPGYFFGAFAALGETGFMARIKRTNERNREMIGALRSGQSLKALAERFGLTVPSVSQIINAERQREGHSPDAYYQALRDAAWVPE